MWMGQSSEGLPLQNKKWPLHSETSPGQKNVAPPALVDRSKIYFISSTVWQKYLLDWRINEKEGFACVRQKFPQINEAKTKEGIFVGPQITQLFTDQYFDTILNSTERRACRVFENVCRNFLGNEKRGGGNQSKIVQELISSYSAVGCNVSLKLHFLSSHWDFFSWKHESRVRRTWRKVPSDITQTE